MSGCFVSIAFHLGCDTGLQHGVETTNEQVDRGDSASLFAP